MEKVASQRINTGIWCNPPREYRAMPFWAWNTKLDPEELLRQIECFSEMGLGGFFMHSRAGMATEYLGEDFIKCVRLCAEYAEKKGMFACLYDEDRWPSGFAGGYVTREKKLRQKQICISQKDPKVFLIAIISMSAILTLSRHMILYLTKRIGYPDIKQLLKKIWRRAKNGTLTSYINRAAGIITVIRIRIPLIPLR